MLPKPFLEFIELLAENDVRFLSYQDLIKNKSSTTRGKDRVDVEELQKRRAGS